MNGRNPLRLLVVLALAVGVVLLGLAAYQVGLSTGLAQDGRVVVGPDAAGYYGWHPFGLGLGLGFGLLGFLATLFFVFLVFGLIRALFFGGHRHRDWGGPGRWGPDDPRWHGHHGWRGGPWERYSGEAFEDWHRRMHESGGSTPDAGQAAGSGRPGEGG